jgi:hypothetical protein
MDPFLEPHWLDVHTKLTTYAADSMNGRLPDDLIASVEERVSIESEFGEDEIFGPDVRVFEPPATSTTLVESPAGGVIAAPFRLVVRAEPVTERFIRIVEAGTERLITVIEFISPTNKTGKGLDPFRNKRAELLASGVNFVEVDLVREGNWRALLEPHQAIREVTSIYRVCTRTPEDRFAVYVYPIRLRDRLPDIPLPLRKGDPEIKLELQAHVDHAYVNGRYWKRIDYRKPCEPRLPAEDEAWADQLLKAAARRQP